MRTAVMDAIHRIGWTRIRRGVGLLYLAVLIAIVAAVGIPTSRISIASLIVSGLMITRIGKGWRPFGQVIVDWLPFTLVLIAYDKTRGLADAVGLPLHVGDVVDAEKWISGGVVPTVWLQQHLYSAAHVRWYDAFVTLVYTTHFLATPVLAAALWLRDRTQWVRYIARVIVLSVAGLATYVVFPEAPPWLAAKDGVIPEPVARLSARGWEWFHLGDVNATLAHAQEAGANPVAAMPSMHVAFACLVAMFLASRMRTPWRWLLVLYPLAMGFTLVYTGEHYVLDLLVGAAYAIAAFFAVSAWERRRAARPTRPTDASYGPERPPAALESGHTRP